MNPSESKSKNIQQRPRPTIDLIKHYRKRQLSGKIYRGDAVNFLQRIQSTSADIVFLDPPFNLGKIYNTADPGLDHRPPEEYAAWLRNVLLESTRILKPGAALYLYHLPQWAMRLGALLDDELLFRHWIAVSMKNGFVRGQRLYPAHYALLYFTKGKPAAFARPKLSPQLCRHCAKPVKDYGGYRSIIEKKGLNLSDFWEDLSPLRHAKHKRRGPNELPRRLFDRIFEISGVSGGLYIDPFCGSGSGVVAAVEHGMTFIAGDIVVDNCTHLVSRLSSA